MKRKDKVVFSANGCEVISPYGYSQYAYIVKRADGSKVWAVNRTAAIAVCAGNAKYEQWGDCNLAVGRNDAEIVTTRGY